ncbi:MAG: hypothetical protein K9H64_23175 [Bacteroidales bacterium]|nr:hypothetical protein [Bacteroidales bacterium]MCF8458923.1 hypothetical protein [Bacteroidales bacterium]
MSDDVRQILRNTKQLVDSDNSIFRKLEPLIAGAGAFFGSKMGAENLLKAIEEKKKSDIE